jgi:hypothetical protein
MGYRSDVALIIHFSSQNEPETAHLEYLKFQHWVKHDLAVESEDASTPKTNVLKKYTYDDYVRGHDHGGETMGWQPDQHIFMFQATNIKWYETFPEVRIIEDMLAESKSYPTAAYRFVRLGEEYEDIVVDDHKVMSIAPTVSPEPWELIEVERTFSFPPTPETLTKEIVV